MVSVAVLQAPELNVSVRLSETGEISLPLVGLVRAADLTAHELETHLEARLRARYIREPDVTVLVTEVNSRPVAVGGAVRRPGVFQIRQAVTLLEVLSMAGGLADDAGEVAVVRRRPSPGQHADASNVLEVPLRALLDGGEGLDVPVHPGDVVSVTRASTVYVVGAVNKPGAFSLHGHDRLTVMRVLALVEGPTRTAATDRAILLRTADNGDREELTVDLSDILEGKSPDIGMQPRDVLFVPNSGGKAVARGTLDALARIVTLRTVVSP